MVKHDARKKVRLCIELTPVDLLRFEDFLLCIPLCKKHNVSATKIEGIPLEAMHFYCKDCEKVFDNWRGGASRVFWRLARQYYKRFE